MKASPDDKKYSEGEGYNAFSNKIFWLNLSSIEYDPGTLSGCQSEKSHDNDIWTEEDQDDIVLIDRTLEDEDESLLSLA
jgi:hypothetical protein